MNSNANILKMKSLHAETILLVSAWLNAKTPVAFNCFHTAFPMYGQVGNYVKMHACIHNNRDMLQIFSLY